MMTLRFGKLPMKGDYHIPRFQHYLLSQQATPPLRYFALDAIPRPWPTVTVADLFPVHGNDRMQNCTVVALAHAITTTSALSGERWT